MGRGGEEEDGVGDVGDLNGEISEMDRRAGLQMRARRKGWEIRLREL